MTNESNKLQIYKVEGNGRVNKYPMTNTDCVNGLDVELNKKVNFTDCVNTLDSSETQKPLSAYMGKELNTRVDNIATIGRYLSGWDCDTGLPASDPPSNDVYTYKSGDYYIISQLSGSTAKIYRPSGKTYTPGAQSTEEESDIRVALNDIYRFDGDKWLLNHFVTPKDTTFGSIGGTPTENAELSTALDLKQNKLAWDTIPTASSTNSVNSGVVFTSLTNGSVTRVGTSNVGKTNQICFLSGGTPTAGISITYGTADPSGTPDGGVGSIYIKYTE